MVTLPPPAPVNEPKLSGAVVVIVTEPGLPCPYTALATSSNATAVARHALTDPGLLLLISDRDGEGACVRAESLGVADIQRGADVKRQRLHRCRRTTEGARIAAAREIVHDHAV